MMQMKPGRPRMSEKVQPEKAFVSFDRRYIEIVDRWRRSRPDDIPSRAAAVREMILIATGETVE
jgi:hypothetical protein